MQSPCYNQRFSSVSFGSFSVLADLQDAPICKKRERKGGRKGRKRKNNEPQYETNLKSILSEQFFYPEINIVCEKLGITNKNPISALLKEFLAPEDDSEEKIQLRTKIHKMGNILNFMEKNRLSYWEYWEYKEIPHSHIRRKHRVFSEIHLVKDWLKVNVAIYEKM